MSVAWLVPLMSPSITEVPPVRFMLIGPEAEVIALTCIPVKVMVSKEAVLFPLIVSVIKVELFN